MRHSGTMIIKLLSLAILPIATKGFSPLLPKLQASRTIANNKHNFGINIQLSSLSSSKRDLDWSLLDGAYLITCPNADPGSKRLTRSTEILESYGLSDILEVKEFETDDEDRIRGCYNSHISVLRDAKRDMFKKRNNKDYNGMVLVLEDNLALSGCDFSTRPIVDFEKSTSTPWDMIHLSYITYVPNLVVSKMDNKNIVKLSCGVGSALGTTAYIISAKGTDSVIAEDDAYGYYAPIPDTMAKLFPESRYASYPVPFQRAANTKSLVNSQLDDLRSILFRPSIFSFSERLLVETGLSTNMLLPLLVFVLLVISGISGKITVDAVVEIATTGYYKENLFLPIVSSAFSLFSLAIVAQGAALAPKQPQMLEGQALEEPSK